MKSLKVKLCLIVALALTMFITLGIFFRNVALANRYVTLSGTSIFVTSGDAEVWAHREYVGEGEADEESGEFDSTDPDYAYYTMFTFEQNDDAVSYRRNLAYKWFYNAQDKTDEDVSEDDEDAEEGEEGDDAEDEIGSIAELGTGYFKMEIGFEEVNFQKFIITFESQQYNMTKDEKTTNYVIFVPAESVNDVQKVYVLITDDKDVAEKELADILEEDITDEHVALDIDHIVIQLGKSDEAKGEFAVTVSNAGDEENVQTGKFVNIGKMYAKYVSSSTKPVTPLSFKAEFEQDEDGKLIDGQTRARMALYEINGQSFVLNRNAKGEIVSTSRDISRYTNDDGSYRYEGGQVNDTQPPVLCLDSGITYVKESSELSFSYTAVDVLTQSPSTVTSFFMLTNAQAADEEFNPDDFEAKGLYRTVTSDEDVYIYPHSNHYIPVSGKDYNADGYGTAFKKSENSDDKTAEFLPTAAIKISLKLTDTASTGGQSTYVFLDWFVEDQYKLHIGEYDYIAVATDEQGATFNYGEDWDNLIAQYQEQVDLAAKNLRAGSDEDFYLPSLEALISDNATAYEDMTFAIYYMVNGTTSSNSGRTSSQLYIDLNAAGDYIFTVYATDNASNSMWYIDDEGELQKFTTGDIWTMYDDEDEEGLHDRLPWFTFTAGISEISIEEPEEQSTAYEGKSYQISAFEVKGVSTKTTYTLYRFNQELYAADHDGAILTYQQFMEDKKSLFEEHRGYFTNIVAQSELDKNSEEYDEFYAYAWNPSTRTFVPQEANAFYLVKCEVTSSQFPTQGVVKEYMGIASSATPAQIKGEDTWVQDNMVSIILLSIAGAAFIGIILLIFIKPKNKGDIDVQFEEEISSKKVKKNKSK